MGLFVPAARVPQPPTIRNRWPEPWTRLQRKQEGQKHQKPPSFPPRLPSFVTITGSCSFMSLIPLLFYVLVKPTQHFMRQVRSKTICQPSWVTRSLAFNAEPGVLSRLSFLERAQQEVERACRCWMRDWQKPSRQTVGEPYLPAPFFFHLCFNWAFATRGGDES